MADNDFFRDFRVTYHWSEHNLLDISGMPYVENQELRGIEAYKFLCQVISSDKEIWNDRIIGANGYRKTGLSVSYKDLEFNNFRVDLGDVEFGLCHTVADSLRTFFGTFTDDADGLSKAMEEFSRDENAFLLQHPELHERLHIEPMTYLYCVSPSAWAAIPDFIQKFYKPAEISVVDKMAFFSEKLPADALFVRGVREPNHLMPVHGEDALQLLIPRTERDLLNDFEQNFAVESVRIGCFGKNVELTRRGFDGLEFIADCVEDDLKDFSSAVDGNCFVPELHYSMKITFHGENIGFASFHSGTGLGVRDLSGAISSFCHDRPVFRDQLVLACKYHPNKVFHMDRLIRGLNPYIKKSLEKPLPNSETSLNSLSLIKPDVPDENANRYVSNDYLNHISKVAVLKSPHKSEIPVYIARELAGDGIGLRDCKSMLRGFFTNQDIIDSVQDAFRSDAETKKILKQSKARQNVFMDNLPLDGLRTAFQRYNENVHHGICGSWSISDMDSDMFWKVKYDGKPVIGCYSIDDQPSLKRIANISDKAFLDICDFAKSEFPEYRIAPEEQAALDNCKSNCR